MASRAGVILLDTDKSSMPMDTGVDGIMVMYGYGESWDRNPKTVQAHCHQDVDEMIYIESGEGWFLHGDGPGSMKKTPWKGPCILWMPAKAYHRVVTTSAGKNRSVLTYTKSGAVIPVFEKARVGDESFDVVLGELKEGKAERSQPRSS